MLLADVLTLTSRKVEMSEIIQMKATQSPIFRKISSVVIDFTMEPLKTKIDQMGEIALSDERATRFKNLLSGPVKITIRQTPVPDAIKSHFTAARKDILTHAITEDAVIGQLPDEMQLVATEACQGSGTWDLEPTTRVAEEEDTVNDLAKTVSMFVYMNIFERLVSASPYSTEIAQLLPSFPRTRIIVEIREAEVSQVAFEF